MRIVWNDRECEAVAEEMHSIMAAEFATGTTRGQALKRAMQAKLPRNRWRSGAPTSLLNTIRPHLAEAQRKEQQRIKAGPEPAQIEDPPAPPPNPLLPMVAAVLKQALSTILKDPDIKGELVRFMADIGPAVAEEQKRRAASKSVERMAGQDIKLTDEAGASKGANGHEHLRLLDIKPPEHPPGEPQTVSILGLLPRQQNVIQDTFGGAFDLRFLDTKSTRSQFASAARASVVVYVMNNFVGVRDKEMLKAVKAPLSYIKGGLTALERSLQERMHHPVIPQHLEHQGHH